MLRRESSAAPGSSRRPSFIPKAPRTKLINAARIIQAHWRARQCQLLRRRVKLFKQATKPNLEQQEQNAALWMQRVWRGKMGRKRAQDWKDEAEVEAYYAMKRRAAANRNMKISFKPVRPASQYTHAAKVIMMIRRNSARQQAARREAEHRGAEQAKKQRTFRRKSVAPSSAAAAAAAAERERMLERKRGVARALEEALAPAINAALRCLPTEVAFDPVAHVLMAVAPSTEPLREAPVEAAEAATTKSEEGAIALLERTLSPAVAAALKALPDDPMVSTGPHSVIAFASSLPTPAPCMRLACPTSCPAFCRGRPSLFPRCKSGGHSHEEHPEYLIIADVVV